MQAGLPLKEVDNHLSNLRETSVAVWDKETLDKIEYVKMELKYLGYDYPNGSQLCKLSRLSYADLQDLIQYMSGIKDSSGL